MKSATTRPGPIAGFSIRLLAQLIDLIGWAFLASLVAVALVRLAPGTFGLASALPQTLSCTELTAPPPGIRPPAGFSPNLMRHCTKSFLGFRFHHEVVLTEERERGELTAEWVVTTRRSLTYAVGPDLKPVEDVFEL